MINLEAFSNCTKVEMWKRCPGKERGVHRFKERS
jgi:hypothetical protein